MRRAGNKYKTSVNDEGTRRGCDWGLVHLINNRHFLRVWTADPLKCVRLCVRERHSLWAFHSLVFLYLFSLYYRLVCADDTSLDVEIVPQQASFHDLQQVQFIRVFVCETSFLQCILNICEIYTFSITLEKKFNYSII